MPTSEEELQKQSQRVEKLRQQVADAESVRVQRERDLANDVTMAQLQAEEAMLEARLAAAKDAGKVGSVKEGAEAPLDAAKEDMRLAVERQRAEEAARQAEKDGN
jgi:hypothetical protein